MALVSSQRSINDPFHYQFLEHAFREILAENGMFNKPDIRMTEGYERDELIFEATYFLNQTTDAYNYTRTEPEVITTKAVISPSQARELKSKGEDALDTYLLEIFKKMAHDLVGEYKHSGYTFSLNEILKDIAHKIGAEVPQFEPFHLDYINKYGI